MIDKPLYIDKIMAYTDTPFVKVITGIRCSDKSTILKMIIDKLQKQRKVSDEQIMNIRFDSMEYEDMTVKDMYRMIQGRLCPKRRTYIFLDEVQVIDAGKRLSTRLQLILILICM